VGDGFFVYNKRRGDEKMELVNDAKDVEEKIEIDVVEEELDAGDAGWGELPESIVNNAAQKLGW